MNAKACHILGSVSVESNYTKYSIYFKRPTSCQKCYFRWNRILPKWVPLGHKMEPCKKSEVWCLCHGSHWGKSTLTTQMHLSYVTGSNTCNPPESGIILWLFCCFNHNQPPRNTTRHFQSSLTANEHMSHVWRCEWVCQVYLLRVKRLKHYRQTSLGYKKTRISSYMPKRKLTAWGVYLDCTPACGLWVFDKICPHRRDILQMQKNATATKKTFRILIGGVHFT